MEQAQQDNAEADQRRRGQTAACKVMYALAGHLAGYEDDLRALYVSDAERSETLVDRWPADVAGYVCRLAAAAL